MIQVLIISSLYSQTQHLRRILLGQAGHIGIQYIKQCTSCRTIPYRFIYYDQYFVRPTAGRGGKQVLLSLLTRSQYQNHQHQT